MTYRADIQIGVKGAKQLEDFKKKVEELSKKIDRVNKQEIHGTKQVTSINEFNAALTKSIENLNKTRMSLDAAGKATGNYKKAIDQYVTALGRSNERQAQQNNLIQEEIRLRQQAARVAKLQAAGIKEVTQYAGPIGPGPASPTALSSPLPPRSRFFGGKQYSGPIGPGPVSATALSSPLPARSRFFGGKQYSGPIGPGPVSPTALSSPLPAFIGPRQATSSQQQAAITQAAKEMKDVYASLDKIQEKRLRQLADESQFLGGTRTKLHDIKKLTEKIGKGTPIAPKRILGETQFDRPIGPETAQRAGLKKGLSQFADFGLGAGFPLLFGGGAGQVAGGGIGTALGKSLGLASQAVFGLQIAFSAVGDQIEQAIRRIVEMQGAIKSLDMDRLAKSTLYVDQNLRGAVDSLVKAAQYADAYALATAEAAMQTGLIGSQQENIAGTANYLGNAWNRLVTSGSAFLSIVGSPLAAALGGVVDLIGLSVKGINMLLSGFGELITRIPGVNQGLDLIKEANYQITEEQAKQLAQADQRTGSLLREAALDQQILDLEKQRVGVVDSSIPGAQLRADLKDAEIDLGIKNLQIEDDLISKKEDINKKYAGLMKLRGNDLKTAKSLRGIELSLAEGTARRRKEEAQVNNERAVGKAELAEQNRLKDEAIKRQKKIQKINEQINETHQERIKLMEQAARSQIETLTNALSLAEARNTTEKQLLSNQIKQAEILGNTSKVYRLKNELAKLDYNISVQRINTEVRKLQIAKQVAEAKRSELQVALALVDAESEQAKKLRHALELQAQVVNQARVNLSVGREIAKEQLKNAQAIKEGAIEANRLANHMERTNQNIANARNNARGLKAELASASSNADGVSSSMRSTGSSTITVSTGLYGITRELEKQKEIRESGLSAEAYEMRELIKKYDYDIRYKALRNEHGRIMNIGMINMLRKGRALADERLKELIQESLTRENVEAAIRSEKQVFSGMNISRAAQRVGMQSYSTSQSQEGERQFAFKYASGGYVSSPTNALVGEGGSEYLIPSSKMAAAMERYAAGKRGNEVVPNGNDTQVNVSTGPVMQMNGQNYVTQSDFEKGLRSTVNQVMTTLRRSPNTRAAVGI